jgi:phosphatidylglycerophosphatase A
MKVKIVKLIASGLYSGYSPFASGTAGSLVGLVIYVPLMMLNNPIRYLLFTAFLFFIGVWASTEAENIYGQKDSGKIVIDEIVGMLVTMFLLPYSIRFIVIGFLLFRAMDVFKPGIKWAEKIPGGLGVMLDDLLAGIMSCLLLHLMNYISAPRL